MSSFGNRERFDTKMKHSRWRKGEGGIIDKYFSPD